MNMSVKDSNLNETIDSKLCPAVLILKLFCIGKTSVPNY